MVFPEALQTSTNSVSSSLTSPVFSHMQGLVIDNIDYVYVVYNIYGLVLRFFYDEIFGLVSASCMQHLFAMIE